MASEEIDQQFMMMIFGKARRTILGGMRIPFEISRATGASMNFAPIRHVPDGLDLV
jgi:hypothetical protein